MANPFYKGNAPGPQFNYEPMPRPGGGSTDVPGPPMPGPRPPGPAAYAERMPINRGLDSTGRPDAALEQRKLFIGGIAVTGIDEDIIRYDFGRFGEIEDCFVPKDRNEPGKIRGIAFVTYRDAETAKQAVQAMHNRNYHGREISVNVAKPRGPDPKKDGTFHTDEKYSGKYDAGGRLRPEFRNTVNDPEAAASRSYDPYDARYDRDPYGRSDAERERDYRRDIHSHGSSYDGTGRYGDRDPRPRQAFYD